MDAQRRIDRLMAEAKAKLPPEPDPEAHRRRAEAFFGEFLGHVLKAARAAHEPRERGERPTRPPSGLSGAELMGVAISYGGDEPPDDVRRALHRLLTEPPPGFDPEMVGALRSAEQA